MGSIIGIPTTRVSDLFIRTRLLNQVQSDQFDLFQIEMQLSTGRRFRVPSEDADAALRVMGLQRLLERKGQVETNLRSSQSYLAATDSALSTVSSTLADVRATALGVIDTLATDTQREAAAEQVQQAIAQLLDTGNQKFRDRYLFAGSGAVGQPFASRGAGYIEYLGDEGTLASYADIDLLLQTNVNGNEVFGAISDTVAGTEDLDPILTFNTRLADLHGGLGIARGGIAISDGTNTSTIDLSTAETIGDVAAMIGANPPEGRTLYVEVTSRGLTIELDGAPGDLLTIREVGGGSTAKELGVLTETGVSDVIVGDDLDPVLRLTTRMEDILGTRSSAIVRSSHAGGNLMFSAQRNGVDLNDTEIEFVPVAGGPIGFNLVGQTLTVTFDSDGTTAQEVIDALAADPLLADTFSASLDPLDGTLNDGSGRVEATDPLDLPKMVGGSGTTLDLASGLQIVNGGETHVINFTGAETLEDVLNSLNAAGAGLLAEINPDATGIDVRSRISGADFMIGENGGTTATQLGIRTFTDNTRLEDLNYGVGVATYAGTDFTITLSDGVTTDVDISGMETVAEVRDLINGLGGRVQASLSAFGNGIELREEPAPGPGTLTITRAPMSTAAIGLGWIAKGEQDATATVVGVSQVLSGSDVNPLETEGVFTALVRLEKALRANDVIEAGRAIGLLDEQMVSLNFARAEIGMRQQGFDIMQARLENENIELQSALSLDFDTDLVEAISQFTARQIAMEAALRTTASILQTTLLNYL